MATFTIALNGRNTYYEIHAAGCRHLIAPNLETMGNHEGPTGKAVAAEFEDGNSGCISWLAPCAAAAAERKAWNQAAPQRAAAYFDF